MVSPWVQEPWLSLLSSEVGVCSFARFSGEFLQAGSSIPDSALLEAAAGGPETLPQEGGQTLCYSALGMVQCCKVTCHELCHLLGLGSCRWLRCLLQGVLSLDEALRRPLDLCPICLRKLHHLLGFRLLERYKRLHTWTRVMLEMWSGQEAGEPSVSEDTLPFSADSGMGCESDTEPVTSPSEPVTPDAWSHTFPDGPEPVSEEGLSSLAASEVLLKLGGPVDALEEYRQWLDACIQALEREVAEEELVQVDAAVDALGRWEMFTGQLPVTKQYMPCVKDNVGLRRVLGDKFSSLRRRLSSRRLAKASSSQCHWGAEN